MKIVEIFLLWINITNIYFNSDNKKQQQQQQKHNMLKTNSVQFSDKICIKLIHFQS